MASVHEQLELASAKGERVRGLLARAAPSQAEPGRGVVLVHGDQGLDAAARAAASRLAGAGFTVLAPDLGASAVADSALSDDRRAIAHLDAAAAALQKQLGVAAGHAAVLGLGRGGTLAWLLGCASTRIAAVVDAGGPIVYRELSAQRPVQPLELALNLGAPLLALFGEKDPATPPADVERMRAVLSQFQKDFAIVTYPGVGPEVGRGFLDDELERAGAHAAADCWQRALAFLGESLG